MSEEPKVGEVAGLSIENVLTGYVKIYRSLLDDDEFTDDPILLLVWIWLLMHTAFEDRTFKVGNKEIVLKRGQVCISYRFLAAKLKISLSSVQRRIKILERQRRIERPTNTLFNTLFNTQKTVLTICNWDVYQSEEKKTNTLFNTLFNTQSNNIYNLNNNYNFNTSKNLKNKDLNNILKEPENNAHQQEQPRCIAAQEIPPTDLRPSPKTYTQEDVAECIKIWGETLRTLESGRDPHWDDYSIVQLLSQHPAEKVKCALRGAAKEQGTNTFNPKKHICITRLRNPKNFDKFISLGAELTKRRILK